MDTVVWAYKPIKELKKQTGLVICSLDLATKLIESGDVQDPKDGALHMKEIQEAATEEKKAPAKKARPKNEQG